MLVGLLGVVSVSSTQAVVVNMGGGHPQGRVRAHIIDASGGQRWRVVHEVMAASSTQVGG